MKKIVLTAAIAIAALTSAKAQINSTVNATLVLQELLEFEPQNLFNASALPSQAGLAIFNDFGDYNSGVDLSEVPNNESPAPSVGAFEFRVRASNGYKVTARAASANFNGSLGGDNDMPCSVLKISSATPAWTVNSATATVNTINALSTSPAVFVAHANGHDWQNFGADINANPGYGYNGGTYNMNIVFTATLD